MSMAEEYCEKCLAEVFYYCLRKTGNEQDAEELAAEISLEIISSICRGYSPEQISAWVWTVAKRRWAKWAKQHYYSPIAEVDIENEDVASDEDTPENALIIADDIARMRRELAFTRTDYRQILVAHYFEEKSVAAIAREFSIPLGTVKTKLQKCRKQLKEGMEMAREFGIRSYKPEDVRFINYCDSFGRRGQPWSILERGLYKNIFLEVCRNPQSAEQISMELGIALPYMEEELEFLTRETFLVKHGKNYETAFPIISCEDQRLVHEKRMQLAPAVTTKLEEQIDLLHKLYGDELYGKGIDYENAKWALLMATLEEYYVKVLSDVPRAPRTSRPDQGAWDVVGYETVDFTQPKDVGQHMGYCDSQQSLPPVTFCQYKFLWQNIADHTPNYMTHREAYALYLIAKGEFPDDEQSISALLRYGYIHPHGNGYRAAIVIADTKMTEKLQARMLTDESNFINTIGKEIAALDSEIFALMKEEFDFITNLKKERGYPIQFMPCDIMFRGYILEQAIADRWIIYDGTQCRGIGAYIAI
ncbi:MAG: sigma-70 family RNA polymerase sigma factor [Clostridia bacterium]|nr:sigma-70 family RNA polymerase sigma factor [Clostridia bacterium]